MAYCVRRDHRVTNIKALFAAGIIAVLTLISTITAQQPRVVDAKILKTAGTAKDAVPGTWKALRLPY